MFRRASPAEPEHSELAASGRANPVPGLLPLAARNVSVSRASFERFEQPNSNESITSSKNTASQPRPGFVKEASERRLQN